MTEDEFVKLCQNGMRYGRFPIKIFYGAVDADTDEPQIEEVLVFGHQIPAVDEVVRVDDKPYRVFRIEHGVGFVDSEGVNVMLTSVYARKL